MSLPDYFLPKVTEEGYSGSQKSEVWLTPYTLCPMPYAQEYLIFLRKAICMRFPQMSNESAIRSARDRLLIVSRSLLLREKYVFA
jgi:hypothetical protein